MKYKRPLATTARPDDASIGRRRNWTALLAILPILHDGGGGGDSDMLSTSVAGRSNRAMQYGKKCRGEAG